MTQGNDGRTNQVRECAPLCLAQDPGWGGINRGWARTGADNTMRRNWCGVKVPACGVVTFGSGPAVSFLVGLSG